MLDKPAGPTEAALPDSGGYRPPVALAAPPGTPDLAALLGVLRRRKLPLLACMLVVPLLAAIAISRVTPRYTATGALIYEPSEYKLRELQSILRVAPTNEAVMASQAQILQSLRIAERVAERGNLFNDPEFNPALRRPSLWHRALAALKGLLGLTPPPVQKAAYGPNQDDSRNATLAAVRAALNAHTVKYSRVIQVSFTAENRQVAATAVNNAMDIYIKDQFAAKHRAVDVATRWLKRRAAELRKQVQDGEDRIAAYRASHGLAKGMHAGIDAERITHLTEQLVSAKAGLANAEGRLATIRGQSGAEAEAAVAPSVVPLRTQEAKIAAELQGEDAQLGPNHPAVVSLRQQLAAARHAVAAETRRVAAATRADVRAARERVAELQRDLQAAELEADRHRKAEISLNAMARDMEASRQQLQDVLGRIQQTAQQAAIETSEAHEISEALPPASPSSPRVVPLMAVAVVSGMLFGLLLVYLLELADSTLHSGEDARAALALPCFALLPELDRRRLGILEVSEFADRRPASPFAEQLRALRAALQVDLGGARVLTVTSPRAGEGKTSVVLALGRAAARGGQRTLVVECDLRRPAFSRHMHTRPSPVGLADCLRGKARPQEVIQRDVQSGLDVIEAGRVGTDIPDLFLSGAMTEILEELRQDYDLILLDAPPAQTFTEARIVAGLADATLLCVRWRATPRAMLRHTVERLEEAHAHVVGTVLTRVDAHAHSHSGYADAGVYHRRLK